MAFFEMPRDSNFCVMIFLAFSGELQSSVMTGSNEIVFGFCLIFSIVIIISSGSPLGWVKALLIYFLQTFVSLIFRISPLLGYMLVTLS